MKGIVFTLKRPSVAKRRLHLGEIKYFTRRYGSLLLFAAILLTGLILGAVCARNAGKQTLNSLDLLFTTNLDARLGKDALGIFFACFASDFLFLLVVYLLGTTPWGLPFELAVILFKGFGIGVTAGYLYLTHALSGAGFYLLVLLPGTFLFCMALAVFSTYAFDLSRRLFLYFIGKTDTAVSLKNEFFSYSSRFMTALILTFFAALLDTVLWTLFAGAFKF